MKNYTLEYLNENAEIEILRFNSETKEYEIIKSQRSGGNGYVEPGREYIYLCEETEEEIKDGEVMLWSQKIGEFRPEMITEEGSERTDAVNFIRSLVEGNSVAHFMANLIDGVDKNAGNHFIQNYNAGKIQ